MSNKNILHVVNIYFVLPYFIGDQFLYFNERGYNLHVICSASKEIELYSKEKKFRYQEVPIQRTLSIRQDIKSLIAIIKYIKKNKIGIVVGHTPKGALLSMIAAYVTRVPKRIYFRHGLVYETSSGLKKDILKTFEKITAFCSNKIVCVSQSLFTKSLQDGLNKENKQIIIGSGTCGGVDAIYKFNPDNIVHEKLLTYKKMYNIQESNFIIGYCGRVVKDKGIIDLVKAFQRLPQNDNKLLIVGGYEERDTIPDDIMKIINNSDNIILTGFIYNDIEYYYSMMDIFILPSYREGFGMSVLEASSMGIPVLTTPVTGCVDSIIEDKTGYYVNNSSESIFEGINKLRNSEKRIQIGKNGRQFVLENFDNRILWPIIESELYKN